MKKFIGITIGVILLFVIVFLFIVHNTQDYGLEKISDYEDFIEYTKDLKTDIFSLEVAELMEYEETAFKYLESQTGDTSILVVKAGSDFQIKGGCFFQNAQIEDVIQGDSQLCGKEIRLAKGRGVLIYSEMEEAVYVNTLPAVNVMKPENRYLVFCEEAEISYALSVPLYRVAISPYALLNIDRDDEHAISDCEMNTFIKEGYEYEEPVALYSNWIDQEFMGNSDETLEVFLSVKNKLLKKYNLR